MLVSFKRALLAIVATTILTAVMFSLTANGILSIVLFPFAMLLFLFLFGITGSGVQPWVKVAKVVAVIIAILALVYCAKNFKVEPPEPEVIISYVTVEPEPTEEEQPKEEGTTEEELVKNANKNAGKVKTTSTKKKTTGKGTLKNPYGDELQATYAGGASNDKTPPQGTSSIQGSPVTDISVPATELPQDQKDQIEKDKQDGKDVQEHPSGVITSTDGKDKDKQEEDTRPQNPDLDTSKTEEASTEPEQQKPEDKDKGPTELDDSELDKYAPTEDNTKPDNKPDENKPQDPSKPEDDKKDEPVVYKSVSIRADSEEAFAGDTIQFFISGDVEKIEGYNGITVDSIKNGTLSINTPDDKTQTITITVIGKDGSKASASIKVKTIADAFAEETTEPEQPTPEPEQKPEEPAQDQTTVPEQKPEEPAQDQTTVPEQKPEEPAQDQTTVPEQKPAPEPEQKPVTDDTNKDNGSNESESKSNPVSVEVIGDDKAYAGDTVQFRVSGDVKKVEGTDGFKDASVDNGVVTINTEPGEATAIDIVVEGVDGSQDTASVNVNCLPQ